MNETIGLIGLALILIMFLTGIELGFAMAIIGFLGFGTIMSFKAAFNLLGKDMFDVTASYGFTVIPLFIFMGQIAANAGIARRLYATAYKFIGHIPGGLAIATVVGATIFKSICGSSPATAATFASVAVPEMDRYNYDKRLSTGIVAVVGTLGAIIPPSVSLILFGMITEQSIGRLFLAGIIPGLLIALFFVFIIVAWCRINPVVGPKCEKSTWGERGASLQPVFWALVIFVVVMGGLLMGFFTPTEAGSIGTAAVFLVSVIRRDISLKALNLSIEQSLRTACMTVMLIMGSTILGHFLTVSKIPMVTADWITGLPLNRYVIMILISLIYQLGGSFIDDLAFMVLATPIFFPVVLKLGFDPIWFGMVIAVTVMIGVVIPPVAINVFVVKNITKVPFSVIYSGVYPFLISIVVCGILLFLFPQIATFLPGLLMK
jgi:C4-dicarboxylate transporter, DctM subunit